MKTEKARGQKNKMALTGFWLGIASIFFADIGIIPILSIIFSSIGLSGNNLKNGGKTYAVIGLILGILYLIVNMYTYGHILN